MKSIYNILFIILILNSCNQNRAIKELALGESFDLTNALEFKKAYKSVLQGDSKKIVIKNAEIYNFCKDSGCWIAIGDKNKSLTANIKNNNFKIPKDLNFKKCDALVIMHNKKVSDAIIKEMPNLKESYTYEMEILGIRFYN